MSGRVRPAHGLVACNEGLLTAALSNLVRNAIAHLDAGPGKRVDIVAADAGDRVRIEVRDTGPASRPEARRSSSSPTSVVPTRGIPAWAWASPP